MNTYRWRTIATLCTAVIHTGQLNDCISQCNGRRNSWWEEKYQNVSNFQHKPTYDSKSLSERDSGTLFHWTVELLHQLTHLRSILRHLSLIRHNRTVARASVLWRDINWLIDWLSARDRRQSCVSDHGTCTATTDNVVSVLSVRRNWAIFLPSLFLIECDAANVKWDRGLVQ